MHHDKQSGLKNKGFCYGFATEDHYKKTRKATFTEHAAGATHNSQITKQNIQVSLAAGQLPKAAPNLIIGYLSPIDPYCDQVMQRRIRTAHKIGEKNQSIDSYQADIELQELNGLDMGNQHHSEHGFHIYSSLIAGLERKCRAERLGKSRFFGV